MDRRLTYIYDKAEDIDGKQGKGDKGKKDIEGYRGDNDVSIVFLIFFKKPLYNIYNACFT